MKKAIGITILLALFLTVTSPGLAHEKHTHKSPKHQKSNSTGHDEGHDHDRSRSVKLLHFAHPIIGERGEPEFLNRPEL